MSAIFISGCAGFIGSHLADAYLAAGAEVVGYDDLSTGTEENIETARRNPRFRFVVGDVCDEAAVAEAMDGCDTVVHLAAVIGLRLVIESPLKTLESNARGSEVVLKLATARKCRTLVTSTSEVYGLTKQIPSSESDPIVFGSPVSGRWSYACSKAYDEFLTLATQRELGLPATVVRLFNTVGARQSARYGMVLPSFVRAALAGKPLQVYGDGTQTRCFASILDVIGALTAIINEPKTTGEVINIGNPHEIRILDLAKRVIDLTKSESPIEFVTFKSVFGEGFEEIMRRVPDIRKAARLIGYKPQVELDRTILDVIEHEKTRVLQGSER